LARTEARDVVMCAVGARYLSFALRTARHRHGRRVPANGVNGLALLKHCGFSALARTPSFDCRADFASGCAIHGALARMPRDECGDARRHQADGDAREPLVEAAPKDDAATGDAAKDEVRHRRLHEQYETERASIMRVEIGSLERLGALGMKSHDAPRQRVEVSTYQ
jgi:hypothetical protein